MMKMYREEKGEEALVERKEKGRGGESQLGNMGIIPQCKKGQEEEMWV